MEKTLIKGLRVLEAVARSEKPCGVSELAAEIGITKSNAFRMLQTLVAAKYVRHDAENGLYSASPRLFEFGMMIGARMDVRSVAKPVLTSVVEQTGENTSIGILDERDVLYIDRVDSPNPVRAIVRNGERLPAYTSSCGKVLLAWSPDDFVDTFAGHLVKHTDKTITNLDALKAELRRIRELGYSLTRGEWHVEISSVAAPIMDRSGKCVAALMVSGPTVRFSPEKTDQFIAAVQWGAREIAEQLA
jgi:DNA-binding IclR family transcriptional regulator